MVTLAVMARATKGTYGQSGWASDSGEGATSQCPAAAAASKAPAIPTAGPHARRSHAPETVSAAVPEEAAAEAETGHRLRSKQLTTHALTVMATLQQKNTVTNNVNSS